MKSNRSLANLLTFAILFIFLTLIPVDEIAAQDENNGVSSREAVGMVAERYGVDAAEWIVMLRGKGGIPQPEEWELLSYDAKAPRLLAWFEIDRRRAQDDGLDEKLYPLDPPAGYVNMADVRVDSRAAFTIAEGEARKARMGFDELNYTLKVREFSREPVWTVDLIDSKKMLVGKVFLSATDGEVLRTMWIYRDKDRSRKDRLPLIIDSAAPRPGGEPREVPISRNDPATRNQSQPAAIEGPLEQVPMDLDAQDGRRSVEREVRDLVPDADPVAADKPALVPPAADPADRLRDMRKPAPTGPRTPENPIFQKPAGKGADTRIPPPPIPPAN